MKAVSGQDHRACRLVGARYRCVRPSLGRLTASQDRKYRAHCAQTKLLIFICLGISTKDHSRKVGLMDGFIQQQGVRGQVWPIIR